MDSNPGSGQILIELVICFLGFSAGFVAVLHLLDMVDRKANSLRFQQPREAHHENTRR